MISNLTVVGTCTSLSMEIRKYKSSTAVDTSYDYTVRKEFRKGRSMGPGSAVIADQFLYVSDIEHRVVDSGRDVAPL